MSSLNTLVGQTHALRNVKEVELKDIPGLTKCEMVTSFKCVESVKMENVSKLGEMDGLKECIMKKEEEERRRKEIEKAANRKAVIESKNDWNRLDRIIDTIVVDDGCCNEESIAQLDLGDFEYLKDLRIGCACFRNVVVLRINGLMKLQSVVIGDNSLTTVSCGQLFVDVGRHFYLKNCPLLKELKIGSYSFTEYSVCEIENVDALEVIEIGAMNEESANFAYAPLELKSILIHSE